MNHPDRGVWAVTGKAKGSAGNPYRILYWMGAGVLLLLLGILLLVWLMPEREYAAPDPERTLIWVYDPADRQGPAVAVVLEESRSSQTLVLVPFPAPEEVRETFGRGSSAEARDRLAALLERQLHRRLFLPASVVATLVDAAGGVTIDGRRLSGAEAMAFIQAGGEQMAGRTATVMLALSRSVATNGVSMGVQEGLALARQVDTDLELTSLPNVLARWNSYGQPQVKVPPSTDVQTLRSLLAPDPVAE